MAKNRLALIFVVVLCLFLACLFLGSSGARSTFVGFDFVIPGDQAAQFLSSGRLPEKSGISSFGSYIPPGTAWLEIPGIALHHPLFLNLPSALVLFTVTLLGIYLLTKECAGPWTGCGAAALFGFYGTGMFWAHSIWPRAHPVCYVWTALFTVWWVKHRRTKFFFGALLVLLLGLSIHIELIFAALPLAIVCAWFRAPVGRWPIPAAIACSLLVWLPYFRFEAPRHFADLRSQLFRKTLPALDLGTTFPGMIEQFDRATQRFKPFDGSNPWAPEPARSIVTAINDFVPSAYSNFRKEPLIASTILAIVLTFFMALEVPRLESWTTWAGERSTSIAIVCLSLGVPWFLLSVTTPPNAPFRHWGLWSLQSVVACIGVSYLWSLRRGRWIAAVLTLAWVIGDGGHAATVAASIAREGWKGRECAEASICDVLAANLTAKTARIGYLTMFRGFELGRAQEDATQKIGIQFDRYLLWQYGIDNIAISPRGYANGDDFRIVQNVPGELDNFRFKPDLDGYTKIASSGEFELWKHQLR